MDASDLLKTAHITCAKEEILFWGHLSLIQDDNQGKMSDSIEYRRCGNRSHTPAETRLIPGQLFRPFSLRVALIPTVLPHCLDIT